MATRSPTAIGGTPSPTAVIDPDALVSRHERRRRLDRPVAVRGVDVGVAESGRLDVDDDLARARCRDRPLLDDQWEAELVHDCCFHA